MWGLWKHFQRKKFNQFLQEQTENQNIKRQSKNLEDVKSVGILFHYDSLEDLEHLRSFEKILRKENKKIKVLVFAEAKETPSSLEYAAFNLKDINKYQIPSGHHVEQFTKQSFDLLISIHKEECLSLQYIAALSKAHFRIGPHSDMDCYDLNLEINPNQQIDSFLHQVNTFLMVLNKTPYEELATV